MSFVQALPMGDVKSDSGAISFLAMLHWV